jgi:cytochrome c-type biogenesis protein CcmH/NrfG
VLQAINLMRKQGIITHWQKMLKENPPKDDKRIRIRIKGQRQKRSGQDKDKRTKIRRTTRR